MAFVQKLLVARLIKIKESLFPSGSGSAPSLSGVRNKCIRESPAEPTWALQHGSGGGGGAEKRDREPRGAHRGGGGGGGGGSEKGAFQLSRVE